MIHSHQQDTKALAKANRCPSCAGPTYCTAASARVCAACTPVVAPPAERPLGRGCKIGSFSTILRTHEQQVCLQHTQWCQPPQVGLFCSAAPKPFSTRMLEDAFKGHGSSTRRGCAHAREGCTENTRLPSSRLEARAKECYLCARLWKVFAGACCTNDICQLRGLRVVVLARA